MVPSNKAVRDINCLHSVKELMVVWHVKWKLRVYMKVAPKVMPPIYFHGNYNKYKEYNNTI